MIKVLKLLLKFLLLNDKFPLELNFEFFKLVQPRTLQLHLHKIILRISTVHLLQIALVVPKLLPLQPVAARAALNFDRRANVLQVRLEFVHRGELLFAVLAFSVPGALHEQMVPQLDHSHHRLLVKQVAGSRHWLRARRRFGAACSSEFRGVPSAAVAFVHLLVKHLLNLRILEFNKLQRWIIRTIWAPFLLARAPLPDPLLLITFF